MCTVIHFMHYCYPHVELFKGLNYSIFVLFKNKTGICDSGLNNQYFDIIFTYFNGENNLVTEPTVIIINILYIYIYIYNFF